MATPIASQPLPLRVMTPDDLPGALALSQKLSWPHRLEDWQLMLRHSHGVVMEDEGRVVATALCCVQGGFSTIGLVIVADEYQGKGLGRRLIEAVLEMSGAAVATLTATVEGAPLYVKLGFTECGHLAQHQAVLAADYQAPVTDWIRPLVAGEHAAAVALAEAGSGFSRDALMTELLAISERAHVIELHGQLVGLALLRPFGRGVIIGPVVAQTPDQARALIESLLNHCADRFVRLDVTGTSGLSPWLSTLGLTNVGEPIQMARGAVPAGQNGITQYAVVTQALG